MKAYPAPWTSWMRAIAISLILCRGGMSVSFRGKGLIVLLLSCIPLIIEAVIAAFIAMPLYDFSVDASFALAFCYVGEGAGIIIPILV